MHINNTVSMLTVLVAFSALVVTGIDVPVPVRSWLQGIAVQDVASYTVRIILLPLGDMNTFASVIKFIDVESVTRHRWIAMAGVAVKGEGRAAPISTVALMAGYI